MVWSPEDFRETEDALFERHAADAVALTKTIEHAKAIHPATVSKQLRAEACTPEPALDRASCTVTDLFTRTRVR